MLTGQPRRRPVGAAFFSCALTLGMAACDDQRPTPTAPSDPGLPAFDHTASHLVVNSVADPGTGGCTPEECTLREAITAANQDPDPSEISFARKFTAGITLNAASGQLEITENLSISGPKGGIVIQRASGDPGFRIFDILKDLGTATVRFTQLTIRGGQGAPSGGGIRNGENLTLANSIVSANAAATSGGGISNFGDLTLMNSTVSGNSATVSGGGIAGLSATITLINSTISGNQVTGPSGAGGGGISNHGGLTLIGSTVSGNSSSVAGGGISNFGEFGENSATVTNSTISGNSASTVGGGIHTGNSDPSTNSFLTLLNSTVVGNSAAGQGGGINHDVNSAAAGFTSLTNSLLALNAAPSAPDVFATFCVGSDLCDARFNLIGVGDGATGVTHGVDGNQVGTTDSPINPNVSPLASNGGATQTHALKAGSPAIDAASTPEGPSTDQRGLLRPQGPASDIGSYERQVRAGK